MLPAFTLGASTYPYPQGTNYAYGNKPATPVTGTWAGDYTNLLNKYNSWKAVHLVAGGGSTQRIQRDGVDSFDSVSEGISYGMILAVYFDDKAAFDNLWAYKQSKNDGLGLMNWKVNSGGGIVGTNSAADADEDIAYALYLAYRQWGGGYKALADAEVLKLKSYDIDGSFKVKPGDSFNSCRYPSYFFPNEYRVFGKETNDAYTWDNVRNNVYATINAARNAATGLVAEQCTDTGIGGGCGVSSSQYQYNSCRVPFRMALDYVYYGDANALTELTKLNTVWPAGNPNGVVDCYNLNGTTCGAFVNSAFVGPAATGFMVPGKASDLQAYYADLMGRNESANYYAGALQLLTLLLLQGNMPNIADPSAIYTSTPTPTQTPFAGSPTSTFTPTPIAFGYIFEDFEVGSMVSYYPYAGSGSGVTGTVTNAVAYGGSVFSSKVMVNIAAGQYGGYGFSSNYVNGLGIMDMSGTNVVRFWINTPTTISMNISFKEGNGVAGGDNEQWKSPNITVFGMAGWQQVTTQPFSAWTKDTSCAPSCNIAGNNIFNLSSIKFCQVSFNAPQAATTLYIDDIAFVPLVAPSPTFTKTPFNNPYNQIYDDFENPMSLSVSAGRAGTYADAVNGASASWSLDTLTVAAGLKSGKLSFNTGTPASYGCGGFLISPYGTPQLYVDATGAVSLALWMNTATPNLRYQLEFTEAGTTLSPTAGADGEAWISPQLTFSGSGWQWVVVDLANFTEDIYNPACAPNCLTLGNNIKDFQAISSVTLKINGNQGVGSVNIDDVNFVTTFKTSTPSQSPSPTASPTKSPTPATTFTSTPTATPSATPSRTPSNSPTASPTTSASPTASPTHTLSFTPTFSGTPSQSPSPTASPSNTPNFSPTATPTFTNFAGSPTNTPTISPSPTNSPVNTATHTPVPTSTNSPVNTATNTPLPSSTNTPANTATPSNTPAPGSPTSSPSNTPSNTPGPPPPASFTPTVTPTATPPTLASATPNPNPTATGTKTFSPTKTVTPMITDSGMTWVPSALTVTVGTTVTWGWTGFHGVASDTVSEPYSAAPSAGGAFSHTFNTPGTYDYHCPVHGLMMSGRIYVTGGPTATPTSTAGTSPVSTITPSGNGPIIQVLPVPNPGVPTSISVLLDRHVDRVSVKFYTKSMVVTDQAQSGPSGPGWVAVPVPSAFIANASSGSYYYVVEIENHGALSRKNGIGSMFILK